MNKVEQRRALAAATEAARAAGRLMRKNLHAFKKVNEEMPHDIKLELDVRCQKLIQRKLLKKFPNVALLGEEGDSGDVNTAQRWVVDPIDGTVNFAYGIPHACVSIALQVNQGSLESNVRSPKSGKRKSSPAAIRNNQYATLVGVVYDPFTDELWTAIRGEAARLNGRPIHVSDRRQLGKAIISIGFAKSKANLEHLLPYFCFLARRVRKIRIMGSAALAMTYVASGRLDAYIERRISLWDIAAGGLIVECAGGEFCVEPVAGHHRYTMLTSNGLLGRHLRLPR